ncbi:MAG: Gfo/Idh/MocA family oxidoreductase [Phycisphaerae bacterium]|nr:Gfo/Idh/MocA family oxidoreductase [Phycisphaerae bacterium]
MVENKIRWLLVGAGAIASKRVAMALSESKNGTLVGVCDSIPDLAKECAAKHGVQEVYGDYDQALSETSANAVYIATPIFLHVPQAAKAVEAGKHLLVEKPLGINAREAIGLAEFAKDKNIQAGCAYYRRCYPCYCQAQKMLADGEFGQIVLVRMTYFSWANPPAGNWRIVKSKSGGGPLSDMGSHMFDAMIGLLGLPRKVYARTKTLVQPYEVEDSAVILMEYDNGADVVATFNWNSKTWSHEFEIVGSEAKIKWHPYDSGKVIKTVGRDIKELDLPNAQNVHSPLVEDFEHAILEGRDPIVPLAEAVKTNIILDAVYASSETGKEVLL